MRTAKNPKSTPQEIYDAEVEEIKRQIREEINTQWTIPSFSFVKNYLHDKGNVTLEDVAAEEEMNLPSTIEEVARQDVPEVEREFQDDPSKQPNEVSGMSMSLLTPELIKSKNFPDLCFYFVPSKKGKRILVVNDFTFHLNTQNSGGRSYWKCTVESCMFRCVYHNEINDIIKVTGKHTHNTNIHQLRTREFVHLLKERLMEDPTLSPKIVYEEELEKLKHTDNGAVLITHMPAFASIRTSLYNRKNKKSYEATDADFTNFSSSYLDNEKAQDISPKAITHLSLEDNENMDYDHDTQKAFPNHPLSSSLEIATPSLYDNHDLIDQINDGDSLEKMCSVQLPQYHEELDTSIQTDCRAEQSLYTATLVPTIRGGQALAVNDCILRSSFTRDSVTYWRCQQRECPFKCSYDTKTNKLLRVSGKHNHTVNPWNVHIRSFVKRLKKRISQGCHLPLKLIYEQEIVQLKKDGKMDDFVSRLPSFESLKNALYKVRKQSLSSTAGVDYLECSEDSNAQKVTEVSIYEGSQVDRHEYPRRTCADPPKDVVIDMIYGPLDTQLTSWLGHDPDKRVIDGHLLVKKRSTDTSTSWICSKRGCLFRCVIDNESKTVLKGNWYHTHRSEVRHIITQTIFGAVKRRVITATKVHPKTIYDEERRRMENKIEKSQALIKLIPSYAQTYQLILKTRAKQPLTSKQESLPKSGTLKHSVIKNTFSESQNIACLNHPITTEIENTINMTNDKNSNLTLSTRSSQDPHQDQRIVSLSQTEMHNSSIEGVTCVDEMEPSFGYDHQSLHQLADFDYPIGEPSVNHKTLSSQPPVAHESTIIDHLDPGQDLTLSVPPITSLNHLNQETSIAQTNLKHHDFIDGHHNREFHSFDYYSSNRQPTTSSQFSYNTHMAQGARLPSSVSNSCQQIIPESIYPPPPPHNQPAMPVNVGTANLGNENTSFSPSSFPVPSSLPSSSSSSIFIAPSSHQSTVYQNNIPQQSPMDKNVFTLHGYPVFPASAQTGNIYWQCRVPDCHFQCVYNVGTGQVVQISGNHNHEPPSSQHTLASQESRVFRQNETCPPFPLQIETYPLFPFKLKTIHKSITPQYCVTGKNKRFQSTFLSLGLKDGKTGLKSPPKLFTSFSMVDNILFISTEVKGSQVTKMLLRRAVEDLDKPIYNVYTDYMQDLHNLLDSNSIFNGFPHYEDVAMAMQNARIAMGINREADPKLMLLQPSQSKNITETSSQDVQIHGAETYADFVLDSINNRLILHGDEMVFTWRQNEILHWKCRKSDCSFKCVYDEDIQSLHILNHHSPHCVSSSKEIYHGPPTKRRNPGDIYTRSSKCPRLDQ